MASFELVRFLNRVQIGVPTPPTNRGGEMALKIIGAVPPPPQHHGTTVLSAVICGREEQAWSPLQRFTVGEPIREGFGQE